MKDIKAIMALVPLLKIYPWALPVIIMLGVLSSLLEGVGVSLFIPFIQNFSQASNQLENESFLANQLDNLFGNIPSFNRTLIICVCILITFILKTALSYINTVYSSWLYSHLGHQIRLRVFQQFLNVSYSFLDSNQSAKLLNTLHTETWNCCDAVSYLIGLIINVCTACVFTILLLLISWKMTLLVVVALLIISSVIRKKTQKVDKLGLQGVEFNGILANRMEEGFAGMRVIRAFGRESYEQNRFECASKDVRDIFIKLDMVHATVGPLSEILSGALIVCLLIIAFQNQATLPTLLTFIFVLYRLQPQMQEFDINRIKFVGLIASVKDVMSLLKCSDKQYIRSGKICFKKFQLAISFKSVSFCYNSYEKPVLQDISIGIPKGKTTALVGPSGAGKSTFVNLICRFYDVTKGEIYVDGYPLRELNLTSWRSQIAVVSQDIYVFSTTIKENIAYGRLDATESEIIAAAKQANAHEFICNLPQGYDTQVGDRGIRLSGGQRQRIAMARAIVRNPEILILDEATNALDSVSEHLIQEAINTLSQDRTVIVIAHRLSTIEQADQILVLDEGRIVEQGNLQHLLKLNGLFAKLYYLQHGSTPIES